MDVLMPQLGETVTEGKITKWFKKAGDAVAPGDNLFEIETDKTSMEVPATFGGTLSAVNFQVGDVAKVGAVVAVILGEGEVAKPQAARDGASAGHPGGPGPRPRRRHSVAVAPMQIAKPAAPLELFREVRTPERNFGPARLAGGITVTPLARRLAGENGIDLSRISGSGPHGRIVARDVESRITRRPHRRRRPVLPPPTSCALYRDVPSEEVPLDGMRKTIAARLTQAKQTIPHFYLTADIGMDALVEGARRGQRRRAETGWRAGLQDFGQRLRHQGAGAGAEAGAGGECDLRAGSHPALPARRYRRCGRARRRPDHAGDPRGGREIAERDLERDAIAGRTRARQETQARGISGRRQRHLQSRHVWRARLLGHHQPAAIDHPRGRRHAAPPGRDAKMAACASKAR